MWDAAHWTFNALLESSRASNWVDLTLKFFPFALLFELPLYLVVMLGMIRYGLRQGVAYRQRERYPGVSCIITCYSEGEAVRSTIESLIFQEYPGFIQIIASIDGAVQNDATYRAALAAAAAFKGVARREVLVLPKWQRGGRVSTLNAGLQFATGEVVMALDADTSFDNDMVRLATRHFDDPNVVGVSGCLRPRNAGQSLVARMQTIEYMLSIAAGKTGLSEFNLVGNISGAFGIFSAAFIRGLGGWDAGTAEDLDLTMRIKQYFGRHPGLRIVFDPHAVGHTEVPSSLAGFFAQRLRWEGDLFYIFIRKYRFNLRPGLLGWRNFFSVVLSGIFLQLIMPFAIVIYSIFLFWILPVGVVLAILGFVYLFYLVAMVMYFGLYLIAVSERSLQDLLYFLYLPLFPLFAFTARVHGAYAVLQEIFLKSHLDSAMAPWWVLKRTKY